MKIIIMAGGKQKRYAPETPKQMIKIDDVRLIDRLIDKFNDIGKIYVIANRPEFNYLNNVVPPREESHELSKFMSSYDIWQNSDEVMFLYGDCYITDDAINTIKNLQLGEFTFYGTACEMLALRVKKSMFDKFVAAINYIKIAEDRQEFGLCGSWTLYRLLLGKDLNCHIHWDNFVFIGDESDDFDNENCLTEWLKKFPQHTGSII